MRRWMRRVLRRYGVELPFTSVICPEHVKTIRFDADWRAEVTVRRALVFLRLPEPGDLCDVVPVDPDEPECSIELSPDAFELERAVRRGSTRIYWKPRTALVPYALYTHEYGWRLPGSYGEAALCTELRCEVRTGLLALEIVTPAPVETALVFKRPRWRRMATERSLVKYALGQLDQPGERPAVTDGGQHVTWRLAAPRVGDRYFCVMFTAHGIARWQKRLKETSLTGRARRLIHSIVPT